jgi:hypothetical protein
MLVKHCHDQFGVIDGQGGTCHGFKHILKICLNGGMGVPGMPGMFNVSEDLEDFHFVFNEGSEGEQIRIYIWWISFGDTWT